MTSLQAKLIVFGFMIFGHCIIIWQPDNTLLRIGDYWVYPAFCYFAAVGLNESKDIGKYLASMLLLALVSQYPYELAGVAKKGNLNIMWHLSASVAVVWLGKEVKNELPIVLGVVGGLIGGYFNTVMGIGIIFLVDKLYRYIPKLSKGNLRVNKYWLYSIYPGHLLVLGGLRQII